MADTPNGPSPTNTRSSQDPTAVHKLLETAGITNYHERVPLQLMDFAYRHTQATLNDARSLIAAGYDTSQAKPPKKSRGVATTITPYDLTSVPYPILTMSIRLRVDTQFQTALPKGFQEELAEEINAIPFPAVVNDWRSGLPPDQYCLLGVGGRLEGGGEIGGEKGVQEDEKDEEDMHDHSERKRKKGWSEEDSDERACIQKAENR